MKKILAIGVALVFVLAGCRSSDVLTGGAGVAYQDQVPTADALPAGTALAVRLDERLSTAGDEVGDVFTATVVDNVIARSGAVVVPAGAEVHGRVTGLDASDHVGDPAAIRLQFDYLTVGNERYDLDAEVVEANVQERREEGIEPGEEAAIGAAAGAALGAILSGDVLETLIGGALGAGVGTAISLGTGDVEAALPAGTRMRLETEERIPLG